ncbi:MAG TPA: class I SAM-dependent methyltransferase [Candidatus Angelobacter sp.]|nr:class I SAM-dependent methyltransferase [Candidatus Angelobacter sp.]
MPPHKLVLQGIVLLLTVVWILYVTGQVRKPSGLLGRRVVRVMNITHASMTDWALQQLTIPRNASVLDVGCGGGRTVSVLSALAPDGTVVGLDYSATSVEGSRASNAQQIAAGRVRIEQGSVAALPFPDRAFDLVTAVETHYYWPDLPANTREVLRVLKPGGTFALIAETYRGGPLRFLYSAVMPLIRATFLSESEHRDLLTKAGFTQVGIKLKPGKNWICAIGRRPE